MFPTMNEKEANTNNPVVVIQQPSQETKKMSSTKKYVIIGVFSIILLGLLLTGILVGMHIFTKAQQDLVEFTLKLNDGRNQDVTSDVTNNVVKYHVTDVDQESWIVSDFNRDIKATKIVKNGLSNCYLSPLNRSNADKPSDITKPDKTDSLITPTGYRSLIYQVAEDPITDISFLGKDARDMCKGVSTYWLYPSCGETNTDDPTNNPMPRHKRQLQSCYTYHTISHNETDIPCFNGCCYSVCACRVQIVCVIRRDGTVHCNFNYWKCLDGFHSVYYDPTPGLECNKTST